MSGIIKKPSTEGRYKMKCFNCTKNVDNDAIVHCEKAGNLCLTCKAHFLEMKNKKLSKESDQLRKIIKIWAFFQSQKGKKTQSNIKGEIM